MISGNGFSSPLNVKKQVICCEMRTSYRAWNFFKLAQRKVIIENPNVVQLSKEKSRIRGSSFQAPPQGNVSRILFLPA